MLAVPQTLIADIRFVFGLGDLQAQLQVKRATPVQSSDGSIVGFNVNDEWEPVWADMELPRREE